MQWSPQQDAALKAASSWLRQGQTQLFRLFGYAGTGKTTLARHLAEGVDGEVAFGAFTGKAALVMRRRGCEGARTIHSMIYRPSEDGEDGPTFTLNEDSTVKRAALIIIDECSMVDEGLGSDLLSFGKPVLVLGDPAQLPPISGGGYFTEAEPDVMLTEIHRQAADDPIIQLAQTVREGGRLEEGSYGNSRIVDRSDLQTDDVVDANQVLVGLNRTRRLYNQRLRTLKGFEGAMPAMGDKLVCLRNKPTKGMLNGGIWHVAEVGKRRKGLLTLRALPEDASAVTKPTRLRVHPAFFEGKEESLPWQKRRESDEFDFGYALTVHKAQGSQWDSVVLFDESRAFREHRSRWLYTGITRAAERLTLVV